MAKGQCRCGQITLTAPDEAINVRVCHCRSCQTSMGGPFFARALFNQTDVTMTGTPASFPSSAELDRLFCRNCGMTFAARRTNGSVIGISLTVFENESLFRPTEHIWLSEKVPWLKLSDGLAQYDYGAP